MSFDGGGGGRGTTCPPDDPAHGGHVPPHLCVGVERSDRGPECLRAHVLRGKVPAEAQYAALREMRGFIDSDEGRRLYAWRAGIEGTLSQGVRSFGLRRARYRGLAKAHLQHVATAVAMNFSRLSDWLGGVPRATTRTSQFARLAV